MKRLVFLIVCAALIVGLFTVGCGKSETEVKTIQEYEEEAAREINKDNAEAELEKIKDEIESDTE